MATQFDGLVLNKIGSHDAELMATLSQTCKYFNEHAKQWLKQEKERFVKQYMDSLNMFHLYLTNISNTYVNTMIGTYDLSDEHFKDIVNDMRLALHSMVNLLIEVDKFIGEIDNKELEDVYYGIVEEGLISGVYYNFYEQEHPKHVTKYVNSILID